MNNYLILLLSIFILVSCTNKDPKIAKDACTSGKGKDFKMYKMSEMAALMEQMYVDNQRLKERISKGDTVGKFPNHFLKIHKAVMTDETDNDLFFKDQAAKFIKAQELIYEDPKNAKQHFNEGVDACIKCHEGKCSGPIPRIKKLYIH
jgi:hypothetical protein